MASLVCCNISRPSSLVTTGYSIYLCGYIYLYSENKGWQFMHKQLSLLCSYIILFIYRVSLLVLKGDKSCITKQFQSSLRGVILFKTCSFSGALFSKCFNIQITVFIQEVLKIRISLKTFFSSINWNQSMIKFYLAFVQNLADMLITS